VGALGKQAQKPREKNGVLKGAAAGLALDFWEVETQRAPK
jgi:hypothetical protein